MDERRKIKRRHLLYYGRVYDENVRKLLGYLIDITESGFMLLSEEAYPVGVTRRLKLEVTEDIGQGPYIDLMAKSVWCEPDVDPAHFDTGFQIEEIKASDKDLISTIIEKYGFRDN
ncbi:MAG TPA: PilZ domain-containing protein [Anaerolineales bacterium]|nr:PilZ domain-containing protein [Anaerolineales bacterium]